MLVGKYLFLALLYGFLIWAFRGLFAQLAAESRTASARARPPVAPAPAPVLAPPAPQAAAPVARAPVPRVVAAPRQPVQTRAALVVREAGQAGLAPGQVIELTAAVTLGRTEDNGIVLDDKYCSGHHAMIFLQGGQRILRDRNSTNGTFHNGQRLSEDVVLHHGDRLALGTVVFEYRAVPAQ